ncbi:hypothetical protein [Neosynechococcus sphagnicola]|uniref:hypothetical protein n=1 Tax=Neosynechococcus sphagnicola TaxID=1501145 RepID=UPI0030842CF8
MCKSLVLAGLILALVFSQAPGALAARSGGEFREGLSERPVVLIVPPVLTMPPGSSPLLVTGLGVALGSRS